MPPALALILATAAGVPAAGWPQDAILASDGPACLATGYCTASGPAGGAGSPAGVMYLALGLVGAGITVLRTERRIRPPEP